LIDIGDLIVHIFLPETREHYKIDDLFEKVRTRIPETDMEKDSETPKFYLASKQSALPPEKERS
jgi:hypothetical protein